MRNDIPNKLSVFMYFLTKDAARDSFLEWLEGSDISEDEYDEIRNWFAQQGIALYV